MSTVALLAIRVQSFARSGLTLGGGVAASTAESDGENPVPGQLKEAIFQTLMSLALVAVTTAVLAAISSLFPVSLVPLAYLIPVVTAAAWWGIAPAVIAAVASAGAVDFYFYPPFHTFLIYDPQQIIDLLAFVFVGLVTGNLAARLRQEATTLRRRESELRDLFAFSRRLTSCFTVSDLVFAIHDYLANVLGQRTVLIRAVADHNAAFGGIQIPEPVRRLAMAMIASREPSPPQAKSRTVTDDTTRSVWLISVVSTSTAVYGAIAVELGINAGNSIDTIRRRVDALLAEAARTLERLDVENAFQEAELRSRTERLTQALIGTVSHDLRTPLASIMGSASVLHQSPLVRSDDKVNALVEAVHDEAQQLDHDIQALLNATLITKRGIRPRLEWVDAVDVIDAAIKQRRRRLASHRIKVEIDNDLPLIRVDSALIEQALGQILENAAKYSTADSEIKIIGRAEPKGIVLSVLDAGAGLTPDEARQLYQRAFRGERHVGAVPGSGLGLWIARTFVAANGGTLEAASPGPGLGTTVSIHLPAGAKAKPEPAAAADE
jgi:K+-sensing histidine kinase KdpD